MNGTSELLADSGALMATRLSRLSADWDTFAQCCGVTYACARGYLLSLRPTHKLALFEFFLGNVKVGQCAVAQRRFSPARARFLESLQLLPAYREHWQAAMQIVLLELGPGVYHHGSAWSIYEPRERVLASMDKIEILDTKSYQVQAVDCAAWPDFNTYRQDLSSNAKRNAAKALKADPAMRIETANGLQALRFAWEMLQMRRQTYKRKGARFDTPRAAIRLISRSILLSKYSFISRVIFKSETVALIGGLHFGNHVYYVDGASRADNGGAAWHLLMETLREVFARSQQAKFVMGADQPDNGRWEGWDNVLRQRSQCKIVNFPTSVTVFRYGEEHKLPSIVRHGNRIWTVYQEAGLTAFAKRATNKLREIVGWLSVDQEAYRQHLDAIDTKFDRAYGVDTGGITHLPDLTITSRNARYGISHIASNPEIFKRGIDALEMNEALRECSFIDLGSGKGRALFLAAHYPFRRIIGVEFAAELHQAAEANLALRPDARIELIHGDAALYEFPLEPLVVYLFHPFDGSPVNRVAERLMRSWKAHPRSIQIVYANPQHAEVWAEAGWSIVKRLDQRVAILQAERATATAIS